MPVISKPATSTGLLACEAVRVLTEQEVLPAGVLQFVGGSLQNFFESLDGQDTVAFTGSAQTAALLRKHENVINHNVGFNAEADSLNAAVLGPDLSSDDDAYQLFLRNLQVEITQKAGQMCTAIRRIFVPAEQLEQVQEDLIERFGDVKVGNPELREVSVGPLATAQQKTDALQGIGKLTEDGATLFFGTPEKPELVDIDHENGYFIGPALLRVDQPHEHASVHDVEVFGPVSTLMPYSNAEDAVALVAKGQGSLVASLYSNDKKWVEEVLMGIAPYHGRVYWGTPKWPIKPRPLAWCSRCPFTGARVAPAVAKSSGGTAGWIFTCNERPFKATAVRLTEFSALKKLNSFGQQHGRKISECLAAV